MSTYTYLIIGGGVAGTTAAETLRRANKEATIAIVTDEPYRLYSRVLLSKPPFLTGTQPFESVWMKTPEWYTANAITLRADERASALDPQKKIVTLENGETIGYEKLLIACGTHTRHWKIPGADKLGVHYLRTLRHAEGIIEELRSGKKHAVMVGSACVTYEVADILRAKDIGITEIMRENYFWEPSLSNAEASIVEERLRERGVELIRDMEIVEVTGGERVTGVILRDGRHVTCDMIFAFIGVEIPIGWLTSSALALERGVLTNEYLETSHPDIWAAGDIARFQDVILDDRVMMGNWMNAVKQGEVAAQNMLGTRTKFSMISFHSSHGFGDMISFAGDGRMRPDREYVMRGSAKDRKLGRFILREGRIVGATMVNRTAELSTIVKLIAARLDVRDKKERLADPAFDLKTLLPSG